MAEQEPSITPKGVTTKPMKVYVELTIAPGKTTDVLKWIWGIKAFMPILVKMCPSLTGYQVHHSSLTNMIFMSPDGVKFNKETSSK